jgi:hypothetical protein
MVIQVQYLASGFLLDRSNRHGLDIEWMVGRAQGVGMQGLLQARQGHLLTNITG